MATALPIFVSHSHEDSAFCQALVTALRDAGADVWFDEHNMHSGNLMDVIMSELDQRKIFILILSKNAFASRWVRRETTWAYELAERDPTRVILPVTAGPIERSDFGGANGWIFLYEFKRIEADDFQPHPQEEAISRTLHALALTPSGEAPLPTAAQPGEDADDLITRGRALQEQSKHAEALALFERATELAPESPDAWFNVGYSLNAVGRFEEALDAYDRAISLDRYDSASWNNKGDVLCSLHRYEEALAACEEALALDLDNANAWRNKASALSNLQRFDEAVSAYDQALALDPGDAFTWHDKGDAYYNAERYGEALAAYNRALDLKPRISSQTRWAWLLGRIAATNGAKAAWHRAKASAIRAKGPDGDPAMVEKHRIHADEITLSLIIADLERKPRNARLWKRKAAVLRRLGRMQEADEALSHAQALRG